MGLDIFVIVNEAKLFFQWDNAEEKIKAIRRYLEQEQLFIKVSKLLYLLMGFTQWHNHILAPAIRPSFATTDVKIRSQNSVKNVK